MKILCLSRAPLDYKGGIPAYCLNLYSNKNFDVTNYSYDLSKKLKNVNVRIIRNIKEKVYPSQLVFGTIAFSIQYFKSILKNSCKYNVVHVQHPDPFSAISVIFAKILNPKIKIIVTWHADVYLSYFFIAPFLLIVDMSLFFLSSKIIFFTPSHLKSSLVNYLSLFRKKIKIIPCCLNIKSNKKIFNKKDILLKKKNIIILSIGRLVKYKGYEYGIKALSNLDEKIIYKIVGSGPQEKKLKDLINKLKLNERVFLMGPIDEDNKSKLLMEADIFLFPSISQSEAYGLVQMEAMANNLPIINTNLNNGVNYLVPDNVGLTCEIKNSSEINFAITKLIENNNFYLQKSNDSYKNFARFKYEKMIDHFKNMIFEI